MSKYSVLASTVLTLAVLQTACIEDSIDFENAKTQSDFSTSVAIPVAQGSFTIQKFFPVSKYGNPRLSVDSTSLLHWIYHQTLDTLTYNDLVGTTSTLYQTASLLPPRTMLPPNRVITGSVALHFPLSLTNPDQIIDEVEIEKALFNISYNTSFSTSPATSIKISSNDIIFADGSTFTATLTPSTPKVSTSLANAKIVPSAQNSIAFRLNFSVTKISEATTADDITMTFNITQMSTLSTKGYFGKKTYILGNQKFPLDYGKQIFQSDEAFFESPYIKLDFENGANVPFMYTSNEISAYLKDAPVTITGFPSPVYIDANSSTKNSTYTTASAIFSGTTNLISVLAKFPTALRFKGSVTSNYGNQTVQNYICKNDKVIVKAYMDLPLKFRLKNVVLYDTSKYDFSSITNDLSKQVDHFKLFFTFSNSYPVEFNLNAYIMDANYSVIDTIFTVPITIKSGDITNGESESITASSGFVEFDKARINKIKSGRYIAIKATGTTFGAENGATVKIRANNRLDFKIIGATKLNLNN